MNPSMNVLLKDNLKNLKLTTIINNYESIYRQATENNWSYEEFILNLTDAEVRVRKENGYKRRIREARFPLLKTFESFDFEAAPDLDLRLIKELSSGTYVKDRRNIILLGKSGTGKTHIATALGVEACMLGIRTRFVTGCSIINELSEAKNENTLSRIIKRYTNYGLLIIDELGYVPFTKTGAELLFQVLAERHEQKPVIITTNKGFGDWTQIFGDATLTAAILDRLTHKAYVFNCLWDSYRLKDTLNNKSTT